MRHERPSRENNDVLCTRKKKQKKKQKELKKIIVWDEKTSQAEYKLN